MRNAAVMKNGKMRNHAFTLFVQLATKARVKTQDLIKKVTFRLP